MGKKFHLLVVMIDKKTVKKEFLLLVQSIMNIKVDDKMMNLKINKISEWDSFNNLMLIGEVEKKFSIKYSANEIESLETVNSVVDSIFNKVKVK